LKTHLSAVIAAVAAIGCAAFATGSAGAESTLAGTTDTVYMKEVKGALKFVAPAAVHQGDELEIVDQTNPKKVGPHSFSLVTESSLPKTPQARKGCFAPKHICISIAQWHGTNMKTGKVSINPVEVGPAGWSTPGTTTKKGDSWFSDKKGGSFSQPVTADPATTPTLYFLCAIHPWMQGKTKVLPAGS
jgi:hypothetical protein